MPVFNKQRIVLYKYNIYNNRFYIYNALFRYIKSCKITKKHVKSVYKKIIAAYYYQPLVEKINNKAFFKKEPEKKFNLIFIKEQVIKAKTNPDYKIIYSHQITYL